MKVIAGTRLRNWANRALAAIFVGLFASLAMPAIYEICGPNEYTHVKECSQYHLPQFILLWTVESADAHNGLLTALFTGVLTVFTIGLWQQTRDSVRIAGKALTELERPYVFITNVNWRSMDRNAVGGLEPGIAYLVANHGKLPAIVRTVRIGLNMEGGIPTQLEHVGLTHQLMINSIIPSGGSVRPSEPIDYESDRGSMTIELNSGDSALVPTGLVIGSPVIKIVIEYDGPITQGHEIEGCWRWRGGDGAFAEFGGWKHKKRT